MMKWILANRLGPSKLTMGLIASSGALSLMLGNAMTMNTWAASTSPPSRQTAEDNSANSFKGEGSGQLVAMLSSGQSLGQCPLKHTSVDVKVSGYVSRVTVKQTFHNPFEKKIEAVYTFPLSDTGAVDDMVMKIGARTIHGTIKKREEAREIYENAKAHGHVASLLDQERPNIFTQSVANIEPGKEIEITLQYIDLLPFEDGKYTFAFPTVVGPRFNPGGATGKQGTGWSPDTTIVPDASKITPPVTPEGTRSGHDISIRVRIDGGVPISNIRSALHGINITSQTERGADVALATKSTIPNRDFVLKWDVAGDSVKSGYLTYKDPNSKSGFFTVMLLPPKKVTTENVAPKEMIFLIDCSGSQSGPPLDKAKETLTYIIDHMNPNDSFQIISFNSTSTSLFPRPRKVSEEMKQEAKRYIKSLSANGGTWMGPAVEAVFDQPPDVNRLRIVTFMTDGYVGNDMEILGLIKKKRAKSRWFSFGTGNSVNRFLIDGIAKEGGGESEFVLLNTSGEEVGKKFYQRIASPVLTDVDVAVEGVEAKEIYPKDISDVWAQKPLYIKGRYTHAGAGTITLTGFSAGHPYKETLNVNFPESNSANPGIASIWARAKVDRLMSEDWFGAQQGNPNKEIKDEIVKTALDHHIMTQYTSFVAVDTSKVTKGGEATTKPVEVEMPDGVSREGVFGQSTNVRGTFMSQRRSGGGLHSPGTFKSSMNQSYATSSGGSGGFVTGAPAPAAPSISLVSKGKHFDAIATPRPQEAQVRKQVGDTNSFSVEKKESDKDEESGFVSKLDPTLRNLEMRFKTRGPKLDGLSIKDGKVAIKVTISDESKSLLAELRKAGLEDLSSVNVEGSKFTLTGRISIKKLVELLKLPQIVFIAPAQL
ncbi:MAG: VIT and VWA domain-containing protein [Candidatus Obscuribacterales bacterium]|nr:VIT and VWA domain-containing protein [Candidatus Obscuribacterales bacterium]